MTPPLSEVRSTLAKELAADAGLTFGTDQAIAYSCGVVSGFDSAIKEVLSRIGEFDFTDSMTAMNLPKRSDEPDLKFVRGAKWQHSEILKRLGLG